MQQSGKGVNAPELWLKLRNVYGRHWCQHCAVYRNGGKCKGDNSGFKGSHILTNWKKYRKKQYRGQV